MYSLWVTTMDEIIVVFQHQINYSQHKELAITPGLWTSHVKNDLLRLQTASSFLNLYPQPWGCLSSPSAVNMLP